MLVLGKLLLLIKAERGCNRSSGGTLPAALLRDFSYLRGVMLRVNRDNLVTFDIYFMATRPPRNEIRINVAETNHSEVLLAEYLRNSGRSKPQSMDAIYGYWYSYALAAEPGSSDAEVELAVIESVIALDSQINRIINFHRINRQINLPQEFLMRYGLLSIPQPAAQASEEGLSTMPQKTNALKQVSTQEVCSQSDDRGDEEQEEDNDRSWNKSGVRFSPAVLNLLDRR